MVRDAYELGARARQHHMCGRADSRLALVLAHSASQHFLGERPAHPADQKRPARARVLDACLRLRRCASCFPLIHATAPAAFVTMQCGMI